MIALLAALALSTSGAPVSAEPQVGQLAPDFTIPDQDGKPWTLSAQKKMTVVVFYPKAFTGG